MDIMFRTTLSLVFRTPLVRLGQRYSCLPTTPDQLISILGLGYVGLPLMIRYTEIGCKALGIDIDQQKVDVLN